MRDVGVQKVPGYSWFEVQNKIHTFSVGLFPSRERENIGFLEELDLKMREKGYVSSIKLVLHDLEEE